MENMQSNWINHVNSGFVSWLVNLTCLAVVSGILIIILTLFNVFGNWQCQLAADMYTWNTAYTFCLSLFGVIVLILVMLGLVAYSAWRSLVYMACVLVDAVCAYIDWSAAIASGDQPAKPQLTGADTYDKYVPSLWHLCIALALLTLFGLYTTHLTIASRIVNDFDHKLIAVSAFTDDPKIINKLKYDFISMKSKSDLDAIYNRIDGIISPMPVNPYSKE